jgi:hypothetical protein
MLNGRELLDRFLAHVATLRSTGFVAQHLFACEGWFRVELIPALVDAGVHIDCITSDYKYQGSRAKADLAIVAANGGRTEVVFELKHLVQFADANKKQSLPVQVERLIGLVRQGVVNQGVMFMAFSYLSNSQPARIISNSFQKKAGWLVVGPEPLLPGSLTTVAIATIVT